MRFAFNVSPQMHTKQIPSLKRKLTSKKNKENENGKQKLGRVRKGKCEECYV